MAANVVVVTEESHWEIISAFLADCDEGAVVVSPELNKRFEETQGKDWDFDLPEIDYYFYEAPDKRIKVVTEDSSAYETMNKELHDLFCSDR